MHAPVPDSYTQRTHQFLTRVRVSSVSGAPWPANISTNFRKIFETALIGYSKAWGKLIHEKTQSRKSRGTVPLKYFFHGEQVHNRITMVTLQAS